MKNNHRGQVVGACLFVLGLHSASLAAQAAPSSEAPAKAEPNASVRPNAAQSDARALIRHMPINDAYLGEVRFAFEVASPDQAGKVVVRAISDVPPRKQVEVHADRTGDGYTAVLPEAEVVLPGFSYYVIERMPDGSERPVFADLLTPHHVRVTRSEAAQVEYERLQAHDGKRSVVSLSAEGVDYGDRRLAAGEPSFHDRYYRLEVGYAYSFFAGIEDVRLSLVRVRGEAALYDAFGTPRSVSISPGIDYGRAAVTFVLHESVRVRAALLLGASQRGFEYGGAGSLIIGNPLGTNLDFGAEALTTLGTTTHLRLGFLASERVPMGASLEVSSFPVGEDSGVRLLYDIGYRFDAVTTLALRGGYQGRTSVSGGASLGVSFDYGF